MAKKLKRQQVLGDDPWERLVNLLRLLTKIILESYQALIIFLFVSFILIIGILYFIFNVLLGYS